VSTETIDSRRGTTARLALVCVLFSLTKNAGTAISSGMPKSARTAILVFPTAFLLDFRVFLAVCSSRDYRPTL
jgi:hypothetical protein